MAIQTKNSALAIKPETTEGTPVLPSLAGDFVALQDDFSMEPSLTQLENAELRGSLGPGKSISGIEEPTASFSHYLRHSGTEGTAPNYGELLKALFGTETAHATEYNTVADSTVSVINVDSDEGANFSKNHGLLIKDATNGYSIRPVHSISTDALTLGFNLSAAPAAGVNLGKAVQYSLADTGHQTLSVWHYIGNSGAIQAMAGARVVDASIEIAAGELINCSYSLEGTGYYFNPVTIDANDRYLDFTDDDGTYAVTVSAKTYKTPHDLAVALTTAMNASGTSETHSVTYSNSTGKFTIATSTSTLLSLLWSTGTNAANSIGDAIGFTVTANDTGATTYAADAAMSWASAVTPAFDSADPLVAKYNEAMIGDADDNTCFAANSVSISIATPKTNIDSICAESGRSGSVINSRTATVSVSALLEQHDAEWFYRLKENTTTRFMYNGGVRTGGNWTAGKCFCFYMPTATVTSVSHDDAEGLVQINLELQAFVDSDGSDEFGLSFL